MANQYNGNLVLARSNTYVLSNQPFLNTMPPHKSLNIFFTSQSLSFVYHELHQFLLTPHQRFIFCSQLTSMWFLKQGYGQ